MTPKEMDVNVWFSKDGIRKMELCDGTAVLVKSELERACILAAHHAVHGHATGYFRLFLHVWPDAKVTFSKIPRTPQTVKRTVRRLEAV